MAPLANVEEAPVDISIFPDPVFEVRVLRVKTPEVDVVPVPALPVTRTTDPPLYDLLEAPAERITLPPLPPEPAFKFTFPPVPLVEVPVEIVTLPVEVEDVPVSIIISPLMPDAELVASAVAIDTEPLAPRSDHPEEILTAPPVGPEAAVAFPP